MAAAFTWVYWQRRLQGKSTRGGFWSCEHIPAISKVLHIFEQGPENIQLCFFLFSNNSSFSELNNREGEDTKNKNGIVFQRNFRLLLTKKPLRKHVWVFLRKGILNGVRVEKEREITLKTSTSSSNEIKGAAR